MIDSWPCGQRFTQLVACLTVLTGCSRFASEQPAVIANATSSTSGQTSLSSPTPAPTPTSTPAHTPAPTSTPTPSPVPVVPTPRPSAPPAGTPAPTATVTPMGGVSVSFSAQFYDPETSGWTPISVSANKLNFGTVGSGDSQPPEMSFQITNNTSGTISLGAPTVPTGFVLSQALSANNLPAGGSATFAVTLLSSGSGTQSGNVQISTSGWSSAQISFQVTGQVSGVVK